MSKFYSIADVAALLSVHRSTIIRTAQRLAIGTRVGRTIIFSPPELRMLRKNGVFAVGNPNFRKLKK